MLKRLRKLPLVRKLYRKRRNRRLLIEARALLEQFPRNADAPRHTLPAPLIVSLTSYPARFGALALTIKSILDQTVKPDQIILWIAHGDMPLVPDELTGLQSDRFTIRQCDDLRNFKKIVPTLLEFPDAFIVTADDDTYYPDSWLRDLVETYDPAEPTIVCHRAHQIRRLADGSIAPYRQWRRAVTGVATERPRTDLLPTGNAGVLYPPGALPPMTADLDLIQSLCATCDDVWLHFMWRQSNWSVRRVPGKMLPLIEWPTTQDQALWKMHKGGGKDRHIQDMVRHFGLR